jgi:(4S)-4-hydroxy-5-phosphonooxypentane-2,3-dione isomerase
MSKIALVVEFDVKPEHRKAFEEIIRGHAKRTREGEPGCLQFDVLIPQREANKVFLFECYRDAAAFEAHGKSPVLAETREKYKDMIGNRRITLCSAD